MSRQFRTVHIEFDLPLHLERGEAGLYYVTSPLIRGLFVARKTEEAAIAEVPAAVAALIEAMS